jgi:hypothetical protein
MIFAFRTKAAVGVCDETRPRRFGYQLRCLEPPDHTGGHRWTPELLPEPGDQRGRRHGPPNRKS